MKGRNKVMNKKINEDINKEKYDVDGLLDFLDGDSTYFVVDNESGVVGNKKTGVMIDKRTGKVFSEKSGLSSKNVKYDFLDYKKSVDVLNNLDNYKEDLGLEEIQENNVEQKFKLKNHSKKSAVNASLRKKFVESKKIKETKKNNNNNFIDSLDFKNEILSQENEIVENKPNDKILTEDLISNLEDQSDEEILKKINEKFNSSSTEFSEVKKKDEINIGEYNFSSFEAYENEPKNSEIEKERGSFKENVIEEKNDLDRFKMIMDFEDYLSNIPDDDVILKSPFDNSEVYEMPKVVVEENSKDDSFSPFDELNAFEVEEIQSYDMENVENTVGDGIIGDLNLNQGISRKVSIREVIKNKQKKKQEQKEVQEKLFFETLDERIEQFKNFREHSIDSQEILNAINMDLNRINSSIRIEFESLNKKRKAGSKPINKNTKKDNKFSLQNLLEEIYEESGEKPSSLDVNELDIESIKKDLAKKESNKNIVN